MKILNFKILRQTILLLLLLLISAFEVSVAYPKQRNEKCQSSAKVKSVRLIEKRTSKVLQIKEMNNSTQVVLSTVDWYQDPTHELYMFTLPPSARPKGPNKKDPNKKNVGEFLLYDPRTERFICRQISRNKKQRRNFITEEYPNLNRCSFTESTNKMVGGWVQYQVGNKFLLNKSHYFLRTTKSCSCPKIEFHERMMALKKKRKGRRHSHLHTILQNFVINPEDVELCNRWEQRTYGPSS